MAPSALSPGHSSPPYETEPSLAIEANAKFPLFSHGPPHARASRSLPGCETTRGGWPRFFDLAGNKIQRQTNSSLKAVSPSLVSPTRPVQERPCTVVVPVHFCCAFRLSLCRLFYRSSLLRPLPPATALSRLIRPHILAKLYCLLFTPFCHSLVPLITTPTYLTPHHRPHPHPHLPLLDLTPDVPPHHRRPPPHPPRRPLRPSDPRPRSHAPHRGRRTRQTARVELRVHVRPRARVLCAAHALALVLRCGSDGRRVRFDLCLGGAWVAGGVYVRAMRKPRVTDAAQISPSASHVARANSSSRASIKLH